ncbi:uncharacterized protein LOC117137287 [Drosophila mauritiana]|uniref:Uncharacterized protein LOC117137287 n=1 Tax=Drosophila mauritiana TaxID=7226 RepID=A0A6P8JEJ4_DROMA|nr:uncharacterized protein LOC117137287 [Drosophila mauritiana]
MNLEDISMIMKLFDSNMHKLQGNLRSYQTEVHQIHTELTEKLSHSDPLDRSLIPLHDHLVASLSEVNAHVMKLNLQLHINRQSARLGDHECSEKSIDNPDSKIRSGLQADCQSSKPAFVKCLPSSETEEVTVVTVQEASSTTQLDAITVVNENLPKECKADTPQPVVSSKNMELQIKETMTFHKQLDEGRGGSQSIECDLLQLQKEEIPVGSKIVVETLKTNNTVRPEASASETFDNQSLLAAKQRTQKIGTGICNKVSKNTTNSNPPEVPAAAIEKVHEQLPKTQKNRFLLPPKGGTETTSRGIYNQILKNTAAFPENTVVNAVLVHVDETDNCVYVAKWDPTCERIKKLLQRQRPLKASDQLPDYGDIFAVYDSTDNIILRITINSSNAGGGYDAYLIDFGNHIHLVGNETIYKLPNDIKQWPALAIRCDLINCDIDNMHRFVNTFIKIRVHENNDNTLVAEMVMDRLCRPTKTTTTKYRAGITEEDIAMLNEIDESTSDPLKAVLGFRPKDEQRICRHYDPKLNGCFKGNNCRLAHEPFAPNGATKDVELARALPETIFDTPVPVEIGSTVSIQITFINGPTEVYGQFFDGSPPLVWDTKDVPVNKRTFKSKPRLLDIVLALYSDGRYYRAQIINEFPNEYMIFYVDYGNTEFLPLICLAPCENVDSLKPHRSVSFHIEGVVRSKYLTHQTTMDSIEYLKLKLLNMVLNVHLVQRLPDGFLIRFLDDLKDIPKQLVQRNYAQASK